MFYWFSYFSFAVKVFLQHSALSRLQDRGVSRRGAAQHSFHVTAAIKRCAVLITG